MNRFGRFRHTARMLGCLAALLLQAGCGETILSSIRNADQSEVIYLFEPVLFEASPALQIDLIFRGDASGVSRIIVPSSWRGQDHLDRALRRVQSLTPNVRIGPLEPGGKRRVEHEPSEIVHLRYWLVQDLENAGVDPGAVYRVRVQPTYFQFVGETGLIIPDWPKDKSLQVSLRWLSIPRGQVVLNRFGAKDLLQYFTASLSELKETAYFGGDFRIKSTDSGAKGLKLALRGQWPFTDDEYFERMDRFSAAAAETWGGEKRGLVSLTPIGLDCCRYQGVELPRQFMGFVAMDKDLTLDFVRLYAQEIFKGALVSHAEDWIKEGFAWFASRRAALQAKIWTYPEFVDDLNLELRGYWSSESKRWSAKKVGETAALDRSTARQYLYRGGFLLMNWFAEARRREASPPAFLNAMRAIALSEDWAPLAKLLGRDVTEEWDSAVRMGGEIQPSPDAAGSCARLEWVKYRPFDVGFDFEASKEEGRIVGLAPDSEAARAGVRPGQKLIAWRILWGDPSAYAEVRVKARKGEKIIRYLPASRASRKVPQFVVEAGASADVGTCVGSLSL